jgi:hypothetical protein
MAELAAGTATGPTVQEISTERLAGAYRRVLRPRLPDHARLARGGAARPAQAVQGAALPAGDLRPVLDPDGARAAVKELKVLQDVLGRFQDSEAQRDGDLRARRRHDGER